MKITPFHPAIDIKFDTHIKNYNKAKPVPTSNNNTPLTCNSPFDRESAARLAPLVDDGVDVDIIEFERVVEDVIESEENVADSDEEYDDRDDDRDLDRDDRDELAHDADDADDADDANKDADEADDPED